ncbi:MAG TPA: PAS domain S-box protein, partial [Bacteroidales bacterium]|nr:PAS domain S-box protein [Bacteroidales bacterium]
MKKEKRIPLQKPAEILIVEDSLTQATQIKHLLESNLYKVTVAQNGKQAWDSLSKHKPSLVITDIIMPEMNGYELCKKIKSNKNTEDIPVILLTRLSDPEEIIEGLSCGADSFITKPYNEKHLLSNIYRILSIENGHDYQKVPFGVQILFNGEKRTIQAEQQNVIRLMLDIYEGAVYQNEKLIQTREELRLLNEQLESAVEERTSDLREEMNLSNQIAEKLRESEEKFRKIFEDHVAVKLLIDPVSGEIIDANKAASVYYGWSHEEFKGMKMDKINTRTFKEIKKEMGNAVSQTKTHFEFRHRLKDGSIRDVEVLSSIIKIRKKDVLHSIVHDITDRKQSEETISILASFPSENPDPVLRVDRNGKLIYANDACYKLLTWELKLGSKVPEALHRTVMKVLGTGHHEIVDEEHTHLLFSFDILPVMEAGYVNIYGHDITERRHAEASLRESEDKFKYIFEHSALGNSITHPNGETHFNNSFCDMLGYTEEELVKMKWQDFTHPDDFEITQKIVDTLVSGESESPRFVKRYLRKDGSVMWADVSTSLRYDNAGKPLYFMTTVNDITEIKLSEAELRLQSEIMSHMAEAVYLVRMEDGIIVYTNSRFEELFGYSHGEMIGKHVSVVNAPAKKSPDQTANEIMNDLDRNGSWAGEVLNIKKDGTVFWSQASVVIFDHSKFGRVLVSVQEDITDRKNTELQIKSLNEELEGRVIQRTELLEAANKELESFSYSVSHDLRAPLRAVHGYTKILQEDYSGILGDEGNRICSIISSSATQMGELIDDL